MRSCYLILPVILFMNSCVNLHSSQSGKLQEPSQYCSLLHIPATEPSYKPKAMLGIRFSPVVLDSPPPPYKCNDFIIIEDVINKTPAMKAGLREKDVILSINNKPVCDRPEDIEASFRKLIEGSKGTAALEILRGKEKVFVSAEIEDIVYARSPGAYHKFSENCAYRASQLEKAINAGDAAPVLEKILQGLNQQTDITGNPFQLKETAYLLRHPFDAGEVGRELSNKLSALSGRDDLPMAETISSLAGLIDVDMSHSCQKAEITLPGLIRTMAETNKKIEGALSNLSAEEKALLRNMALKTWDSSQWNDIIKISLRIDLKGFFEAFNPLLCFMSGNNLEILREDLVRRFGNQEGILYEETTPFGKVIVGGTGRNVYTEDAALILDLGGDDMYLNNAAGTRPGMNVAVVIDWDGNDVYISRDNFSQGAGVLGGGFLIDLSGSDAFNSPDGSQGTGFFGIGFLYHRGGNSFFTSRSFSQGAGQMGIGYLLNIGGDDVYVCSEYGQGIGFFRGAGVLIDTTGNDYYILGGLEPDFRDPARSTVSIGQGFGKGIRPDKDRDGVAGGIGILIDKEGNDTYIADYFAQGAAYYYGIGILNDMQGNDRYISGRYSQGAGIHSSVGIFIENDGDDFYYASYGVAQGMGHDYGVGYFEDRHGDDHYKGGTLSQGAATNGGIGIIIDLQGKDNYVCGNNGQAFAQDEDCMGIMIDAESDGDILSLHSIPEFIRLGIKKEKIPFQQPDAGQ